MVESMQIAKVLVEPVVRLLLTDRRRHNERSLPLSELINLTVTDDLKRRKVSREIETILDAVVERIDALRSHEWAGLSAGEYSAACAAVVGTFVAADLSDAALFAADADPVKLSHQLRRRLRGAPEQAGLGETASALYHRLLSDCCVIYVQLAIHLSSFPARGIAALLDRTSSIGTQFALVLDRLPVRTLDASAGTDFDDEFAERYARHISTALDELDLFGVDVHRYRPRTTLSVAYISLAVSERRSRGRTGRATRWARGELSNPGAGPGPEVMRVEAALADATRILIRGNAGSGKTTLVHWLAINAARGAFAGELSAWNDLVPFLVKLRRYAGEPLPGPERFLDEIAGPLAALMPAGWAHRQLSTGRALLLVDGVDELVAVERRKVQTWLRGLLAEFPEVTVVVTSRPAAALPGWLAAEGFGSAELDRMSPADVRELIAHWYRAVRDAGNLPCSESELPAYERALLNRLELSPHLQGLATSPLLCAMLCALNLDRRMALPQDRMSVYAAAIDLLLQRRDIERGIPGSAEPGLNPRGKLQLLQHLAWKLSLNNRAESSREDAVRRVADRLASMPMASAAADDVLDHLIHRSGIIREPSVGRIDFVHRTFQEYLTACEVAEQGDAGYLLERAHLDTWRETIIMAVGHANSPTRHELLAGLLDRADDEPRHARTLRLLAAACLETVGPIDQGLRARTEKALARLLPPRRAEEAKSLASAGTVLLQHVPTDLSGQTEGAAAGIIEAVALVGGPEALTILSRYAADSRPAVQELLHGACEYFDPADYGGRVLVQLDTLHDGVRIVNRPQLDAWKHVTALKRIEYLHLFEVQDFDRDLAGLPPVTQLWASGIITDLAPLVSHADVLQDLNIWSDESFQSTEPLRALTALRSLVVSPGDSLTDLEHLRGLHTLESLWLLQVGEVEDFSPVWQLKKLQALHLHCPLRLRDLAPLGTLPELTDLGFADMELPGGLERLAGIVPGLRSLDLYGASWLRSLGPVAGFQDLRSFTIDNGAQVADLTPLTHLPSLKTLDLACPTITDLRPVLSMPSLATLYLRREMSDVDLSVFNGGQLTIRVGNSRLFERWRGKLGGGVQVVRNW